MCQLSPTKGDKMVPRSIGGNRLLCIASYLLLSNYLVVQVISVDETIGSRLDAKHNVVTPTTTFRLLKTAKNLTSSQPKTTYQPAGVKNTTNVPSSTTITKDDPLTLALTSSHLDNQIISESVILEQHHADKLNISYKTKWYTQLVDHFTWANQDTWQQRYLVNDDFWCGNNCPILFYCGNEGDIEMFTNNTGFMWENADRLHAMLVFAEHRFYGQSMPYKIDPTKVDPNETKTLGYLSSEQALADYAKLVFDLTHIIHDSPYSPVIAIGGSYGGMLASWMRMKYPNAVTGALAASAPILQFPDEYDCELFNRITTQDYEGYSKFCSQSISRSWSTMRSMASEQNGLRQLGELFNTCSPIRAQDVDSLLNLLTGIWVNMAMVDYPNKASFLANLPEYPIKHVCNFLNTDPLDLTDSELVGRISRGMQVFTNYTGQMKCLNIEAMLNDPMDVLWGFQSCTEMVMPICSDGVNDMFEPAPWNLTDYVAGCHQSWGVKTQVDKIRTLYGDKRLESASNIIFSLGTRDPWSAGSPQKGHEKRGIHLIVLEGACHHEDLRPTGPNDTKPVIEARNKELNIITDWITLHYEEVRKEYPTETLKWVTTR